MKAPITVLRVKCVLFFIKVFNHIQKCNVQKEISASSLISVVSLIRGSLELPKVN